MKLVNLARRAEEAGEDVEAQAQPRSIKNIKFTYHYEAYCGEHRIEMYSKRGSLFHCFEEVTDSTIEAAIATIGAIDTIDTEDGRTLKGSQLWNALTSDIW